MHANNQYENRIIDECLYRILCQDIHIDGLEQIDVNVREYLIMRNQRVLNKLYQISQNL